MNRLAITILFGLGLLTTGCTVHHYHHTVPAKDAAKKGHGAQKAHHGRAGHHGMSKRKGNQLLDGFARDVANEYFDGHHCGHEPKAHHGMRKGHGPKGHGLPKGHPRMGGHEEAGEHQEHANLPAPVKAFHDSFAAVWHEKSDAVRSTAACAKFDEWQTLAAGVSQHKAQRDQAKAFAVATKTLNEKIGLVAAACRRKSNSVQAELTVAHDALHALTEVLKK